ncbi:unnamed protein product [Caretta caretta]
MAKHEQEIYINSLVDEAEEGLKHNNQHPVYKAVTCLVSSHKHPFNIPITKLDRSGHQQMEGVLDRWKTHYKIVLSHTPADNCPDLHDLANCLAADPGMHTDPQSLEEA